MNKPRLDQGTDYERGFVDGMQHQMQSNVDKAVNRMAQLEPNKDGSPCPEFWDWLPKAYNFDGNGAFTKYNMEVAFLAGKQASQPEQKPVAWLTEERYAQLHTPQRTWVGLTDEDISEIVRGTHNTGSFVRAIEAKLKQKNT